MSQTKKFKMNNNSLHQLQPLLCDPYRIETVYSYWKMQKNGDNSSQKDETVFELYSVDNPSESKFAIFAGIEKFLEGLLKFQFEDDDLNHLEKEIFKNEFDPEFFSVYLKNLKFRDIKIYSMPEGSIIFPRTPIMVCEGKLSTLHLLEPYILSCINTASMITTNAARFRMLVKSPKQLSEWGNMRANSCDAAILASKYCFLAGFDSTSNILANKEFPVIPVEGTYRTFINALPATDKSKTLLPMNCKRNDGQGEDVDLSKLSQFYLKELINKRLHVESEELISHEELATFVKFAITCPNNFYVSAHIYDVIKSGLPNFCAVALAIASIGYEPRGIRIDSQNCVDNSHEIRGMFKKIQKQFSFACFEKIKIIVTSDINEQRLKAIVEKNNEIDVFGIGYNAVMNDKQQLLRFFYDLVEINKQPIAEFSRDKKKFVYLGRKKVYRLYESSGEYKMDLITTHDEEAPIANKKIIYKSLITNQTEIEPEDQDHTFTPSRVEDMLELRWEDGQLKAEYDFMEIRTNLKRHLSELGHEFTTIREGDNWKNKVFLSRKLYEQVFNYREKNLTKSVQNSENSERKNL